MWPLDCDISSFSMEDKGQRKIWKGRSKGEIFFGGFRGMLQLTRKCWPAPQRRSQLRSPVFVGLREMPFAFPSAAERKADEIQLFLPPLIGDSREVIFTFSVSSDGGGTEECSLVSQPYWQLCVVGLVLLISTGRDKQTRS